MVTAKKLLGKLPPFTNTWVTVKENQKVKDIIKQILAAHKKYAGYYDSIALYFDAPTIEGICKKLYNFCKAEIKYNEEPEENQTTALPTGILTRGYGDCKHYASFCGGVLDALQRLTGKEIDWCYRFASYKILTQTPHHVFIVVFDGENEIWIDPVPGANKLEPVWLLDKKINAMPLRDNIGSVGFDQAQLETYNAGYTQSVSMPSPLPDQAPNYYVDTVPELPDTELPSEVIDAIEVLQKYGVVNNKGDIDQSKVIYLSANLPGQQSLELNNAIEYLNNAKVSGIFSDIFRGVKKVTLVAPRGAFLSAVALNVFGMATKLKQATKTQDGVNKVRDKWYMFGGDWAKLRQAIDNGAQRKKIGGVSSIGAAVAVPAWVATAAAIIAAIMPLVNAILKNQQQSGMDMSSLYNEYGSGDPFDPTPTGNDIFSWIKQNPLPSAVIGFFIVNLALPPNKRFIKF